MKIKIKVKNLLLIVFLGLFIYLIAMPYGTIKIAKHLDYKGSDRARVFYESFISKSLIWNKSEALYEYGNHLIGSEGKFKLMMMGWGGEMGSSLGDMEKGIDILKEILEKENKNEKDMKYAILAYEKLMATFIELQSPEDLIYWINWGKGEDNEEINYISDLYLSFYHFVNREYDLAEELLNKYHQDSKYIDEKYYYMKAELDLRKGDIDSFKQFYETGENFMGVYRGSKSIFNYRNYDFKDYYTKVKGDLKIKGRISFNGKPMPFVQVYLQDGGKGYRTDGGHLVGITDINGEYETLGLGPNKYELGIGLNQNILYDKVYQNPNRRFIDLNEDMEFDFSFVSPFKIINPKPGQLLKGNKLTVEWEPVKDAEYYEVNIVSFADPSNKSDGNITFPIMEDENNNTKIKGTRALFDIEKLKELPGGLSWSGEDMIVNPSGILGMFVSNTDYPIVINAYDKYGKLLNSTAALRTYYEDFPSIIIEGELTEGEKLIENKKYEEAIEYYTNILEKDSNNKEALLYLSKIYMVGYEKDKSDYNKAMAYATRYDNLNYNNALKYQVIEFMDHDSRRKYSDLILKVYEDIPEENRDENFYYRLGKYYLSLGKYDLARESFENIKPDTPIYIMYIDLYFGEIHKALSLVNSVDIYNMDKKELIKALEGIDTETTKSNDYKILKDVIEKVLSEDLSPEEGYDVYVEANSKIKSPYIKILLEQIKEENYWDMEINLN